MFVFTSNLALSRNKLYFSSFYMKSVYVSCNFSLPVRFIPMSITSFRRTFRDCSCKNPPLLQATLYNPYLTAYVCIEIFFHTTDVYKYMHRQRTLSCLHFEFLTSYLLAANKATQHESTINTLSCLKSLRLLTS